MNESQLRKAVVDLAHEHGWMVFYKPDSPKCHPPNADKGYPDLTLARRWKVLHIELKAGRWPNENRPDDDQRKWADALGQYEVWTPDDLNDGNAEMVLSHVYEEEEQWMDQGRAKHGSSTPASA